MGKARGPKRKEAPARKRLQINNPSSSGLLQKQSRRNKGSGVHCTEGLDGERRNADTFCHAKQLVPMDYVMVSDLPGARNSYTVSQCNVSGAWQESGATVRIQEDCCVPIF